jgi:UDP-N-acetylglucosamine 2-epimerase (non-hydrolysing)
LKKVLLVFGTRPEAIKMAPLVKEFQKNHEFIDTKVCVTAQHRGLLDQVTELFDIHPDYDLDLMKDGQDLYDITSSVLLGMRGVLGDFNPDIVLVHGDTTTTSATSLAAFYQKIKIGHVEAGLRTRNIYNPWPEEVNRQMTSVVSNYHFAPTEESRENLLSEGKDKNSIIVTGNTVIDALLLILKRIRKDKSLKNEIALSLEHLKFDYNKSKFIIVTAHRRESFGGGFLNICNALKVIAIANKNINLLFPVHPNPNVQNTVNKILSNIKNIHLVEPLQYEQFIYLMEKSYFIITDSGGIQEEAPSIGKPVLVMRNTTERLEAIKSGGVKLIGTEQDNIVKEVQMLLNSKEEYKRMSEAINPYGDGLASNRIYNKVKSVLYQ